MARGKHGQRRDRTGWKLKKGFLAEKVQPAPEADIPPETEDNSRGSDILAADEIFHVFRQTS